MCDSQTAGGCRARRPALVRTLALMPLLALSGCATETLSGALLDRLWLLRTLIAVATLGLLLAAARVPASARRRALLGLALVAFLANFQFFARTHVSGFHAHEFFHYYLGAKYFPELGYYDLYPCTLAALDEASRPVGLPTFAVRDLRQNRLVTSTQLRPRGGRCADRFDEARWRAFRSDLASLQANFLNEPRFRRALMDYGYNPSPVWTLLGRPIAELVPASDLGLNLAARIDLLLLASTFALLGWAFGLEIACLAVIAWAANPLTRYGWIGDSFLRYAWFAATFAGIGLLRRGRGAAAGALLCAAACMRLFPLLFSAGVGVRGLTGWIRERRVDGLILRYAASFVACALLLVVAATWVSGRGMDTHRDFVRNIRAYDDIHFWNAIGLRPLVVLNPTAELPAESQPPETEEARQQLRAGLFDERRWLYYGIAALALGLFVRASVRCLTWESAALGFGLVPILTAPPAYYLSCVVGAALLAERRPRLGIAVAVTLVAWNASHIAWPHTQLEYQVASAIALALITFALLECQRACDEPQGM